MKSKEDHLRSLFAQNRNSYELNDPHVMLYELGANLSRFMINTTPVLILSAFYIHIFISYLQVEYPLILNSRREQRPQSGLAVVSPAQFTANFDSFTENQFKGMNWNNVIVAGGCVLGMLQAILRE